MDSVVTVSGVAFEWPNGRVLFENLNFYLDNKITALVGVNGIGKSALAKLISKELSPSAGSVICRRSVSVFSQQQEAPDIHVEEYLATESPWSYLREQLLQGISLSLRCTELSGGQWMRVRLARVLNEGYLILDEPTNNLDRSGRELLKHFLREHKEGVLLISHDREFLELCNEVLELSNRGLQKYGGTWESYTETHQQERASLGRTLERAKQSREASQKLRIEQKDRQEKRNRKGAQEAEKGGMPKILIGRRKRAAENSTGKIDEQTLQRLDSAVSEVYAALQEIKSDPVMYADLAGVELPAQKLVAEACDYNVRFQDWLYPENLNFTWRGNIRVAVKGKNGSGKTTFIKALLGEDLNQRGELRRGKLRTLYVDQRCNLLDDEKSLFENIRDVTSVSESEIRNGLAKFLFTKEVVFQKVKDLSGGERLRATLALGLLATEKPELLVLDEPTNNLDLVNIQFLEQLTSRFRGAVIVISHDEVFLKNCRIETELHFELGAHE
jgi:ATPase subunit of ABC transporter with duplicated ATPase domains